jgi:hypothetical protein
MPLPDLVQRDAVDEAAQSDPDQKRRRDRRPPVVVWLPRRERPLPSAADQQTREPMLS